MRYHGGQALGLVETVGLVPALEACDKMLKASNVKLVSYENVGSTLVTIMVVGDVAAVEASVEAGAQAAAAIGKLTSHNVMPRPIPSVGDIVSVHDIDNRLRRISWKDIKLSEPLKHLVLYIYLKQQMPW